ncbi:MAG: 16S rRNA (cytosine(1407)-C(5))-methyltransferase RsmF [Acidobacteriota bacterium]
MVFDELENAEFTRLVDALLGAEAADFVAAVRAMRATHFRFNRLKLDRAVLTELLRWEGVDFVPVPTFPGVFRVTEKSPPAGKSLAHFLGGLYIQDPASMLPARILSPRGGERVLDLCASPGSKTTQLAEILGNRGCLFANDVSAKRGRNLVFNLRRTGVLNTLVTHAFGESLGNLCFESFDCILLDAPCSALGTLQKSPEVLRWWTAKRSHKLAAQQRQLLHGALKALRPGGRVVYSTCTIAPWENEEIIQYALDHFPVELLPPEPLPLPSRPGLECFAGQRFHPSMTRTRRIYPHEAGTEGFFLALLRKTDRFGNPARSPGEASEPIQYRTASDETVAPVLEWLSSRFGFRGDFPGEAWFVAGQDLRICSAPQPALPGKVRVLAVGLPVAHLRGATPALTTEGSHLWGAQATRNVVELVSSEALAAYVNRGDLALPNPGVETGPGTTKGQVIVRYRGMPLGHGWFDHGKLLSRFPHCAWRFGPAAGT